MQTYPKVLLNDEDLKELFSLFTSPTKYEVEQVYDKESSHYHLNINLEEEYDLTEEKREYALDAWRAVLYFLHRKGFSLVRNKEKIDLSFIENHL